MLQPITIKHVYATNHRRLCAFTSKINAAIWLFLFKRMPLYKLLGWEPDAPSRHMLSECNEVNAIQAYSS